MFIVRILGNISMSFAGLEDEDSIIPSIAERRSEGLSPVCIGKSHCIPVFFPEIQDNGRIIVLKGLSLCYMDFARFFVNGPFFMVSMSCLQRPFVIQSFLLFLNKIMVN